MVTDKRKAAGLAAGCTSDQQYLAQGQDQAMTTALGRGLLVLLPGIRRLRRCRR